MRASLGCDVVVVCVAAAWGALYLCVVLFCLLSCLLGYCCLAFDYDFVSPCLALPLYMYMSLCVCVCGSAFGIFLVLMSFMRAPGRPCALFLLCCCCQYTFVAALSCTHSHTHAQFSFVKFVSLKF